MLCLFFHAFVSFAISRILGRSFFFLLQVRVMIMSPKVGNLGHKMAVACHVIFLNLWWHPYAEDPSIDWARRIRQTRPVTESRLTVKYILWKIVFWLCM